MIAAGVYAWELRASLSGAIYTVDSGAFDIIATAAVTAASDQRTFAEKTLAAIESEIQARIDGTGSAHESYTIGTRQLNKIPLNGPNSLSSLRVVYQMEVQRQRNNGRLPAYVGSFVRP